jgi:anti-sigma regulatory factor (Ser/Thr protein kinase)
MMKLASSRPESCEHLVRFYDGSDDLVSVVVGHLRAALTADHVVIVIATAEHRRAFHVGLRQHDIDVDAAESGNQLVWLDATATLARFTHDGVLDSAGFDSTVGAVIRRATSTGHPVDAYGEMVALLWQAGNVAGALELEDLWNGLAERVPFSLLCTYPSRLMQPAEALAGFSDVCNAHTRVLGGAPVAPEAELSRRFPPSPAAPSHARRFVAESLDLWQRPDLVDAALLVTSELATNAVRHARSDFTVSLARAAATIVVTVCDSDAGTPRARPSNTTAPGGRGLAIVEAVTAAWGHRHVSGGKLVWAELSGPLAL